MRKLTLLSSKVVVLGAVIGTVVYYHNVSGLPQAGKTRVTVSEQKGSPIQIFPTYIDSSNPLQPIYGYSVTNTTDKAITAYAVVETIRFGTDQSIRSTVLTNFPAKNLLLRGHDSRQEDGGHGKTYPQIPVEIILSVDFVEFENGSRWGEDLGESGQKLNGKRAGGKAAIKKYREILAKGGVAGLEQALADPSLIKTETSNLSPAWLDGFATGVNTVKHRMAVAKLKSGQEGARRELEKPFDSSDGRADP